MNRPATPTSEPPVPITSRLNVQLRVSPQPQPERETRQAPTLSTHSAMTLPPYTTPAPRPVFMPGVSHQGDAPQDSTRPSPLPVPNLRPGSRDHDHGNTNGTLPTLSSPSFDLPRLRLRIDDIAHRGSSVFLNSIDAATALPHCTKLVLAHLYSSPTSDYPPPTVRSTTLILRPMDGVAHTIGSDLDPEQHKEIHFSLGYIASLSPPPPPPPSSSPPNKRAHDEILGVLTHELVHCHQYNGQSTCPGGLVEGIADFVRLRAGLSPPHWSREPAGDGDTRWDRGYQNTAYFLDYLDEGHHSSRCGGDGDGDGEKVVIDQNHHHQQQQQQPVPRRRGDLVRKLNKKLRAERYVESTFWEELLGKPVGVLWGEYQEWLKKKQAS